MTTFRSLRTNQDALSLAKSGWDKAIVNGVHLSFEHPISESQLLYSSGDYFKGDNSEEHQTDLVKDGQLR